MKNGSTKQGIFRRDDVFPPLEKEGEVTAQCACQTQGAAPAVKILHHMASACEKEILIQNPYFLPSPKRLKHWQAC